MTMESPVRILLGAALVANLLLLSSTVSGNAMPLETTPTTRDDRAPRLRANTTFPTRRRTPDVALNELHPKDSVSEEHTEKNAKYKHRGRVRFSPKSTTTSPLRRRSAVASSTQAAQAAKLIIVTPTPEVKKPAQIIDSMRTYKRTKMPVSSTTAMPSSVKTVAKSEEEEEEYEEEEEEENDNFEKYTSSKFDSNFFTIPSYSDNFGRDSEGADNKVKSEYSSSPYSSFSSFFPEASFGPNKNDEPFKSDNFFDFDAELTTPKNDFFDKKHHEISQSIIKTLDSIKVKMPPPTATNVYKVVKENLSSPVLDKNNNTVPTNKSTILIKNTKEVRLLDNDGAGTNNNKELSDVQGTSIYYEMSVLSTETYNIDSNDDDCDNDTLPNEPTPSTSDEEELAPLKATPPSNLDSSKSFSDSPEVISTLSSNFLPFSSVGPTFFSSVSPISFSTQNSVISSSSTEKTTRVFSSSYSRNRNYSKRLGNKESPNSVTSRIETTNYSYRSPTRKFHYTTPKVKPIWMAPRRNTSRISYTRSTVPTTIYQEHFDIKDKLTTTPKPRQSHRTSLTTVSSEIDPVLQSDISGVKKVVHSQSLADNSIQTLRKRGSTKYSSSTVNSAEAGVSDLEIPPTLTAWALASLRSPPSLSSYFNTTTSTHKSIDENELQKVGDITDKKETTTTSTTTASVLNNDIISEKITEIDQNRLPWKPAFPAVSPATEAPTEPSVTEAKSERLPAESNISIQSSAQPASTTEKMKSELRETTVTTQWVPVTVDDQTTTEAQEAIPPVDAIKSTGFESITKLPSGLTTPQDDTINSPTDQKAETATVNHPSTTDYEITTIRFSYVPTEESTESESMETTEMPTKTTSAWHPVFPTRTKATTIKDEPITTYRPVYVTTTDIPEETTMLILDTTPQLEVSSQVVESTEKSIETTASSEETTEVTTEEHTTKPTTTTIMVSKETTAMPEDTTTMIVEVVTEINTEISKPLSTEASTELSSTEGTETPPSEIRESSSEENSDSNEVITQETTRESTTTTTTTTTSTRQTTSMMTTPEVEKETEAITEFVNPTTQEAKMSDTTLQEESMETIDSSTKSVNDLEDLTSFSGEMTTEASSRVLGEESGSGAAIAIAVSTIGVIALILLVGLLLVVRRRGRRGVYAQRCTPVSLDAYSLDSVSVGHRKGNHRLRASKRSYGNPAYDDEVTSHPMQYAALANFALDIESMSAEFAEIPSVSVRPDEVPPGCEDKNRYSNVLPLPDTRVPLKRIGNDPTTEYINANFITGPGNIRNYYIACQAPLPNTVTDFWRMVWEQNSRVIVMLTEYMENGVEKCYEYLPPSEVSDNKRTFGDYQIILMKREQRDKYAISSVQLINLATRTWREVTHLWYFWPAKGVPDDYESVIDFLSEMRSYMKISQTAKEYDEEGVEVIYGDQNRSSFHNLSKLRSDDSSSGNGVNVYSPARAEELMKRHNNGTLGRMKAASEVEGVRPCVVVCASGAGRSAAVIAADVCARALAAAAADVPRVVREIRAQRPHSLANRHHYIFLYKLLSEYGNKLMGGGVDTI